MIRNQWYVIAETREIGRTHRHLQRLGENLVLFRDPPDPGHHDQPGNLHCLLDLCCHRAAALSAGRLVPAGIARNWRKPPPKSGEVRLQCPFHGLEYAGDGRCTCIPANAAITPVRENFRVRSYPVHEAHGWVWIWWGRPHSDALLEPDIDLPPPESATPPWFDDIPAGLHTTTAADPWTAHYSRVIENQLDVVHVPFVHYNTIGRGDRTVVDGPGVRWENDRMLYTYVFNRLDDGTPPRKPSEVPVPPPGIDYKLEFLMPNLWQNRIAAKLRIVGAFVPVDAANTLLYLRTYQGFTGLPGLRQLVHLIFRKYNRKVAFQDRRIVQTQEPKASALRGGENLLQGDLPILEYRKRRQELLDRVKAQS